MFNPFIWNSEAQENELDIQNIVNNAVYLQYFDRARIQHLLSKGIDLKEWHQNGFNLVLIHVDMAIKQSLKAHDKFYVKSTYEKSGRLKVIYDQTIYKTSDDTLVAKAINTLACVSIRNGKPVMPGDSSALLFASVVK